MIKIIWIQISFALHYPNNIIPKFCFTTILSKSCHSCGAWAPVLIIMRFNPSPFSIQLKNGRIWRQCNSPWWINCWKIKPQTRSHVDIKTYNKKKLTLIDLMESHSCALLVFKDTMSLWWRETLGSIDFSLSTPKTVCVCALKYSMCFSQPQKKTEKKTTWFFFSPYIYINKK